MALGSAAVLAVYAAGYLRTQSAAEAMELEMAARRAAGRSAPSESVPVEAAPLQQLRDTVAALADSVQPTVVAAPAAPVAPRDSVVVVPAAPVVPTEKTVALATSAAPPADTVTRPAVPAIPEYIAPPAAPPAAPAAAPPPTQTADSGAAAPKVLRPLRDGAWHGYGSSRHGDIEVRIEVAGEKVVYAEISRCMTRWPCTLVERLPGQVIERQTADVDIITGATASSDAFYLAVLDAFSTARGK